MDWKDPIRLLLRIRKNLEDQCSKQLKYEIYTMLPAAVTNYLNTPFKGTVVVIYSDSPFNKVAYPIHNGTLKKLCLSLKIHNFLL